MCAHVCVIARVCRLRVAASHIRVAGVVVGLRGHSGVRAHTCVGHTPPPAPPAPHQAPHGQDTDTRGGAVPLPTPHQDGCHPGPLAVGSPVPGPAKGQGGVAGGWRGGEKTPACPWRGCNSINEAWPSFSAANKANGPAQAWRCLVGGRSGGHLLIKWRWGTMEPAVMSPPWCLGWGGHTLAPPACQPSASPAGVWGDSCEVCGTPPKPLPPAPLRGAAAH